MHLNFLDPTELIPTVGQIGIILVIFAESFFAFFLPGDSLLFAAGLFAAIGNHGLNIWVLTIGCSLGAIAGNQMGYWIGRKSDPALFARETGLTGKIFKMEYLEKTHSYFEKHGPKTIVLARFIPVVRTFACIVAGAGRMNYRTFLTYNVIGGVAWAAGITILGYFLGNVIPADSVDKYLLPIIALIIFISVTPAAIEFYRARQHSKERGKPTPEMAERLTDVNAHSESN